MAGRPKKRYEELHRPVYVNLPNQARLLLATILILCPVCGTWEVTTNGTRPREDGRVESFSCKNPACPFLRDHKAGKQFVQTTSKMFREGTWGLLRELVKDLFGDGARSVTVARKYRLSPAEVSALRAAIEAAIEAHRQLDQLVDVPQSDTAVAIDETFVTIGGKTFYIIIATGYTSRKTLGVRVSATRTEADLRDVFDEAERNTRSPISTVTSDASSACQKMTKNLGREVVHVIHRHKKPYDKAVIRHITYVGDKRVITDVGVKTDVFKRRGTREVKYLVREETLHPAPPKPRGRPKGVKNGQGKKKPKSEKKGPRRGLFAVFDRGRKTYAKVSPYRGTLQLSRRCPAAVTTALRAALSLYPGLCIQNNLSESANSVLRAILHLSGPKTGAGAERRIRAALGARNDLTILDQITLARNVRGTFLLNNLKVSDLGRLAGLGWEIAGLEKTGAGIN